MLRGRIPSSAHSDATEFACDNCHRVKRSCIDGDPCHRCVQRNLVCTRSRFVSGGKLKKGPKAGKGAARAGSAWAGAVAVPAAAAVGAGTAGDGLHPSWPSPVPAPASAAHSSISSPAPRLSPSPFPTPPEHDGPLLVPAPPQTPRYDPIRDAWSSSSSVSSLQPSSASPGSLDSAPSPHTRTNSSSSTTSPTHPPAPAPPPLLPFPLLPAHDPISSWHAAAATAKQDPRPPFSGSFPLHMQMHAHVHPAVSYAQPGAPTSFPLQPNPHPPPHPPADVPSIAHHAPITHNVQPFYAPTLPHPPPPHRPGSLPPPPGTPPLPPPFGHQTSYGPSPSWPLPHDSGYGSGWDRGRDGSGSGGAG
ncbi:hypothetical protein M427DRAFT_56666 [Gonapodya prolifera JEL478]|uniref:Zn(2)-C6 fungal-type domain-containing protein n=1 Tax=Gonapodya prolifera (strain JEL478) TaxID=1344416 RepID=A0A139AGQ5_GONPJ|nr:hypothetical protein M427DRAFT_56666 [Gonapodya prolifera JEL478]|eukprot:KXS15593.1 hypothetical protein M427DRAFT_56666 [Gonapodya prolifera JEL478]